MTQIIRFVNSCFIKIQFIKIQKEGDERAMLFGQDGASASLYGDLSRCTLCRRTVLCFSMTENRTVIFDRDINRYARYSTVTDFARLRGLSTSSPLATLT